MARRPGLRVLLRTQWQALAILRRALGLGGLLRLLPRLLVARDPFARLGPPGDAREHQSRKQMAPAVQLYQLLRARLGQERALAVTREVVVAATLQFLASVLPRFDRDDYRALGERREAYLNEVTEPFHNATREFVDVSEDRFEMRVNACHLHSLSVRLGIPELAPVFCAGDRDFFSDPTQPVAMERETTLAEDGRPCRFVFRWKEAEERDSADGPRKA